MTPLLLVLAAFIFLAGGLPSRGLFSPEKSMSSSPSSSTDRKPAYSKSGHNIVPLTTAEREVLAAKLTPEAFQITQKEGTERPFCGTLLDNKKNGTYMCVVCGLPLFASQHKFDSGTGWPSFFSPYDDDHITRTVDRSHGMTRTEISCARCDAHLGHVFPDGPPPSGERHCLNSAALTFVEEGDPIPEASRPVKTETAYFAAGCFWGVEHWFQQGDGVISAESGYMQGRTKNPTYKDVCYSDTGHAEAVKVVFDPARISYAQLVEAFFKMHDPTQVDRQGPDIGSQYRSGIYAATEAQKTFAQSYIDTLNASGTYQRPIATEVESAKVFYPAEDYHQDYIEKTGRACHVQNPWTDSTSAAR